MNMKNLIMLSFLVIIIPTFVLSSSPEQNSGRVEETPLGYSKVVDLGFEQALTKVKEELKKEGF